MIIKRVARSYFQEVKEQSVGIFSLCDSASKCHFPKENIHTATI